MREFTVEQARKYSGKTQQSIADELNICRGTYINLEKKPESFTILQAKKFADAVGLPLDEILFKNKE